MRELETTSAFRKDFKRCIKRGCDEEILWAVVEKLLADEPLEARLRDHPLRGNYVNTRELHLRPDWLLIYQADDTKLVLVRTGSHSDLF